MKRGKRYQEAEKLVDKKKNYSVKEALETIEKMPKPKSDETVELHVKLGVDSKQADQQVEVQQYFQMVQEKHKKY